MVHAVNMMTFPQELFDYIINSLDAEAHRSTLLSCSLVSRSWVHAARRSLFKVFIVARRGYPNFLDLKNFLRSENPGFCVYVKTLVLRSGADSQRHGRLDRATFLDIIEAFPKMESIWLQDIDLAEDSIPFSFSPRSQQLRLAEAEQQPTMREEPRNRPSIDSLILSNACICERMFAEPPYIVLLNFLATFSYINYLSVDGLERWTEPLNTDSSSPSPVGARAFLGRHDISSPLEIHINQLSVKSWDNSVLIIFKHILQSPSEDLLTLEYLERGLEGDIGQITQVIWRDLIRDLGARLYVLRICFYGNQVHAPDLSACSNLDILIFSIYIEDFCIEELLASRFNTVVSALQGSPRIPFKLQLRFEYENMDEEQMLELVSLLDWGSLQSALAGHPCLQEKILITVDDVENKYPPPEEVVTNIRERLEWLYSRRT